jgi:hypothetical protein
VGRVALSIVALGLVLSALASGCDGASGDGTLEPAGADPGGPGASPGGSPSQAGPGPGSGSSGQGAEADSGAAPGSEAGGTTAGWLYTKGNKLYVRDGQGGGAPWMGRGVNLDDIYFCGYNTNLWMTSPDQAVMTTVAGLMSDWKPNFIRLSLSMNSFTPVSSWVSNAGQYKTPMTNIINAIGAHPNTYVLVTLRSDASMTGQDETTSIPTPATDPVYVALVDTFANSNFVLFGLSNEPGGTYATIDTVGPAMQHAVGVIRAEEDRLGVPHHIVSVQGSGYTSDISHWASSPLAYDNVVYEVHGYPPPSSGYTYDNIPVILGEYGSLTDATGFYADVEAKQIPNLAWDFDAYNDCSPDLLQVTGNASSLQPSAWGKTVQSYLLAHAK